MRLETFIIALDFDFVCHDNNIILKNLWSADEFDTHCAGDLMLFMDPITIIEVTEVKEKLRKFWLMLFQ